MKNREELIKESIEVAVQAGINFMSSLSLLMRTMYDNVSSITIRMEGGEKASGDRLPEEDVPEEVAEKRKPEEQKEPDETAAEEKMADANTQPPQTPAESVTEKQYTKEDVRVILTGIAKAGHKQEVKDLLAKYNATHLGKVDPKDYAALVADAEVLANG